MFDLWLLVILISIVSESWWRNVDAATTQSPRNVEKYRLLTKSKKRDKKHIWRNRDMLSIFLEAAGLFTHKLTKLREVCHATRSYHVASCVPPLRYNLLVDSWWGLVISVLWQSVTTIVMVSRRSLFLKTSKNSRHTERQELYRVIGVIWLETRYRHGLQIQFCAVLLNMDGYHTDLRRSHWFSCVCLLVPLLLSSLALYTGSIVADQHRRYMVDWISEVGEQLDLQVASLGKVELSMCRSVL